MSKILIKIIRTLFILIGVMIGLAIGAHAQSYTQFLGPAQPEPPKFSQRYGIPYLSNGFESAIKGKWKQARRRGQPKTNQDRIRHWGQETNDDRFISTWIDQGFDAAKKWFGACPGERGRRARALGPSVIQNVTIAESIFYDESLHAWLAAGTYPDRRIKVVNVYAGSTGDWRHAQSLLAFEMKNAFAIVLGVKASEVEYQRDACVE